MTSNQTTDYTLTMERYMKMPTMDDDKNPGGGAMGTLMASMSWLVVVLTFPLSMFFCFKVVHEYERAVIFRLGRLQSSGSRGIFFVLPCIEHVKTVDIRSFCFDVPPQEVLTKDSVTVTVDAVVYCRVSNAMDSILNVSNAHSSTKLLSQTQLRNVLGKKNLAEALSDRDGISKAMQESLNEATDKWGIIVERVEIKDVRLPVSLQRAMAAEAEADRGARAKVIAAQGEKSAALSLKQAADTLGESPAALQLRYLQSIISISGDKESTIVFPIPVDLMQPIPEGDTSSVAPWPISSLQFKGANDPIASGSMPLTFRSLETRNSEGSGMFRSHDIGGGAMHVGPPYLPF